MSEQQQAQSPPGPSPIPQAFAVQAIKTDVGGLVHLIFFSATGQYHVFLDAGSAESFADQVRDAAGQSRTTLLVPRTNRGLVVPTPQPGP